MSISSPKLRKLMASSLILRYLRDLRMYLTYSNKLWIDLPERTEREKKLNITGNSGKSKSLLERLLMLSNKEPSMSNKEELKPKELLTKGLLSSTDTNTNTLRISEDTVDLMSHG